MVRRDARDAVVLGVNHASERSNCCDPQSVQTPRTQLRPRCRTATNPLRRANDAPAFDSHRLNSAELDGRSKVDMLRRVQQTTEGHLFYIITHASCFHRSVATNPKGRVLSEALPYIHAYHGKTLVIRFGG